MVIKKMNRIRADDYWRRDLRVIGATVTLIVSWEWMSSVVSFEILSIGMSRVIAVYLRRRASQTSQRFERWLVRKDHVIKWCREIHSHP